MKYISTRTRTLVDFPPIGEPTPVYFQYQGKRIKIDNVIEKRPVRKTFDNCIIYKCECSGKLLELRWDKDRDMWYLDKI